MNEALKQNWWKYIACVLLFYSVVAGFIVDIPGSIIGETVRNLFFHVGMWFAMIAMLATSFFYSVRYLSCFDVKEDIVTVESVHVGLFFGIVGILTGMIWAKYTWGAPWVNDPKLNGTAVGIFIYLAYMVLRGSIDDTEKRAKISSVYNIFAFVLWIVFVIVMPRLASESIHPGKESLTVLPMHLEPSLRFVFYPAMIGWILLGFWLLNIRVRIKKIQLLMN